MSSTDLELRRFWRLDTVVRQDVILEVPEFRIAFLLLCDVARNGNVYDRPRRCTRGEQQ